MNNEKHGLAWHFPLLNAAVSAAAVPLLLFAIAGMVAVIGDETSLGLGLLAIGMAILGLRLDWEWMKMWPLPPAAWFTAVCALTAGVGPALLRFSGEPPTDGLVMMQLAILIGYGAFLVTYTAIRPRVTAMPALFRTIAKDPTYRQTVVGCGLLCLLFAAAETTVGAVSGLSDRGQAGERVAFEVFGYWSYFAAFSRISAAGFFLLPVLWIHGGYRVRLLGGLAAAYVLVMAVLSGSRYAALMPFVTVLLGYVGWVRHPRIRAEVLVYASLPLLITVFVFLDHFRNTATFQETALTNPIEKFGAVAEARQRSAEYSVTKTYLLGERLVGVIDPLVFETTPLAIPHAGFEGAEALAWLYVPTFFSSDRPSLIDGTRIAERYLRQALIRTSVGTSLTGDWYRRFGWGGVVGGMALVGAVFALALRLVAGTARLRVWWAIALILTGSSLSMKDANMTVATALWHLFYDIPKYTVALVLLFSFGAPIGRILTLDNDEGHSVLRQRSRSGLRGRKETSSEVRH